MSNQLPIQTWAARYGYDPSEATTAAKFTAFVMAYAERHRIPVERTNIPAWLPQVAVDFTGKHHEAFNAGGWSGSTVIVRIGDRPTIDNVVRHCFSDTPRRALDAADEAFEEAQQS